MNGPMGGWRGESPRNSSAGQGGQPCKDYHCTFPSAVDNVIVADGAVPADKGFCARGEFCQFQHEGAAGFDQPGAYPAPHPFPPMQPPFARFDSPPNPSHNGTQRQNATPGPSNAPSHPPRQSRPTTVHSQTTLVVEGIPQDSLTLAAVQHFFGAFGQLTNVIIDQTAHRAIVSFAHPDQARRAHSSPAPVFGNRFVKVFRQRVDPTEEGRPPNAEHAPAHAIPSSFASSSFVQSPAPSNASTGPRAIRLDPTISKEQDARTQRAARLQANAAEQSQLIAKLEESPLDPGDKAAIMTQLRALAVETKTLLEGGTSDIVPAPVNPQALLAQLRLEVGPLRRRLPAQTDLTLSNPQAQALGIDPLPPRSSGGRGRARGSVRAAPYSHQGRGGPPRAFKLDNRTSKILVGDLTSLDAIPVLQAYFEVSSSLPWSWTIADWRPRPNAAIR